MALDFTITRTEDGRAWLERPGERPKALGTPFQSAPLLQLWDAYQAERQAREDAEHALGELRTKLEAKHKR